MAYLSSDDKAISANYCSTFDQPRLFSSSHPRSGSGATSQINQALMNAETSLAFKCVSVRDKIDKSEAEVLACVVNEMTALWHPAIRNDANILQLQGLCWDISPDIDAEPSSIIHGDIKPQNVLVFRDKDGPFTPKMADFGFSTWSAADDNHIILPQSWPWNAPEINEYPTFTPQQAAKTDVFSFGMLCLWFLFEQQLSGMVPLPEKALSVAASLTDQHVHQPLRLLDELKREDALTKFASQLVMAETGLTPETRAMLQLFFSGCLACDPQLRDADVQHSLKNISIHQEQPISQPVLPDVYSPADGDFKLGYSLLSFYLSDYRLRCCIFKSLQTAVKDDPTSPLSSQLALCYALGFGHSKLEEPPIPLTCSREELQLQIEEAVIEESKLKDNSGALYTDLADRGHFSWIMIPDIQRDHDALQTAERVTREDVKNLESILGVGHPVVNPVKAVLARIKIRQCEWGEAEEIEMQLASAYEQTMGPESREALRSMGHLAMIYTEQGRWREAEQEYAELLEITKTSSGPDHPDTLVRMSNLAATLWQGSRWLQAEQSQTELVDAAKRVFGQDHPLTMTSMSNLSLTLRSLGCWEDAKEVVDLSKKSIGPEHPTTLGSMTNLAAIFAARTLSKRGRWDEAKDLSREIVDTRERILGPYHEDTLTATSFLASMLRAHNELEEAEEILLEAVKMSRRALGNEDPVTLRLMSNLALTFSAQNR
ncbi:hypothetical protein CEP54_015544 [Fusarium duplospermum]|uniref:Protein kinase domain-containing protein n=1 Tax=Fusarium duplospermum TaxID=1325734 RepID=A0A428NNE7_9HYPO|nr:hypothetical protein CEP54_015544 [Fusarium duplospermum]